MRIGQFVRVRVSMCLLIVLYDVALLVSWSLNRNACFRHFRGEKKPTLEPPVPLLSVFIGHLVGISAADYLLFILYIFKIYPSTVEIKEEPIFYRHQSYKTYTLVHKAFSGLLLIEKTYFVTSESDGETRSEDREIFFF